MITSINLQTIGFVSRDEHTILLAIEPEFRPALQLLDQFSHILVVWWADQHDNLSSRSILVTHPPYQPDQEVGIFATRAEYRPNPIAITVCKLENLNITDGILKITNIDAYDGTPVLDLKGYYPVCDRVEAFRVPGWAAEWPEWLPEEGLGLN